MPKGMNINLMSFSMKKLELQPRRNREVGITRSTRTVSLTPEVLASIWWAVCQKNRPRARICALDECSSDDAPQISVQTPTASQIWVKGLHSMSAVKVCSWGCPASRLVWIWLGHLHATWSNATYSTSHFLHHCCLKILTLSDMIESLYSVFSVKVYYKECSKTKRKKYYS